MGLGKTLPDIVVITSTHLTAFGLVLLIVHHNPSLDKCWWCFSCSGKTAVNNCLPCLMEKCGIMHRVVLDWVGLGVVIVAIIMVSFGMIGSHIGL